MKKNYFFWGGSYKQGVWALRIFSASIQIKAPWNSPLFSERHGHYNWKIGSSIGWRLIYRKDH